MDKRKLLLKIPFWIFCISMFLFFYIGTMYPEETNYWIEFNAIPIFIIEFISIFSTLFLLLLTNKEAEKQLNVKVSGVIGSKISKRTNYLVALITVFIMAFAFLFVFSIWIFAYFLLSHVVKYFAFKQIKTTAQTSDAIKSWGVSFISFLFAALISAFSMFFTYSLFSVQIFLINQHGSELVQNIEFFILWGASPLCISCVLWLACRFLGGKNWHTFRKASIYKHPG